MTPIDELRAAAKTLRETAEALRAEVKPPQQPLMWFAEDLIIGAALTGGDADSMDHKLTRAEVSWLALASPALAEPLAAVLERLADMAVLSGGPVTAESLALARAINANRGAK